MNDKTEMELLKDFGKKEAKVNAILEGMDQTLQDAISAIKVYMPPAKSADLIKVICDRLNISDTEQAESLKRAAMAALMEDTGETHRWYFISDHCKEVDWQDAAIEHLVELSEWNKNVHIYNLQGHQGTREERIQALRDAYKAETGMDVNTKAEKFLAVTGYMWDE